MCRKQKLPGPPAAHTALHSMPRADRDGSCVQGNGRKSCVCRVVPFAFCALLIRRSSCCCFAFFIILNTVLLFPLLFTGDSYSYFLIMYLTLDFPSGAVIKKKSPANAGIPGDRSSVPGSARSLGGGNGNPLQYSCLENPLDRGAWRATATWSQRVRHNGACT